MQFGRNGSRVLGYLYVSKKRKSFFRLMKTGTSTRTSTRAKFVILQCKTCIFAPRGGYLSAKNKTRCTWATDRGPPTTDHEGAGTAEHAQAPLKEAGEGARLFSVSVQEPRFQLLKLVPRESAAVQEALQLPELLQAVMRRQAAPSEWRLGGGLRCLLERCRGGCSWRVRCVRGCVPLQVELGSAD